MLPPPTALCGVRACGRCARARYRPYTAKQRVRSLACRALDVIEQHTVSHRNGSAFRAAVPLSLSPRGARRCASRAARAAAGRCGSAANAIGPGAAEHGPRGRVGSGCARATIAQAVPRVDSAGCAAPTARPYQQLSARQPLCRATRRSFPPSGLGLWRWQRSPLRSPRAAAGRCGSAAIAIGPGAEGPRGRVSSATCSNLSARRNRAISRRPRGTSGEQCARTSGASSLCGVRASGRCVRARYSPYPAMQRAWQAVRLRAARSMQSNSVQSRAAVSVAVVRRLRAARTVLVMQSRAALWCPHGPRGSVSSGCAQGTIV